jgi:hypothetical protein
VDAALVVSALLLGLAGTPHCAAMCGAACAGVVQGCGGARVGAVSWAFHAGRLVGYAAVGALLAAGVGALQGLATTTPALRPLWILLHVAVIALGLWMAVTGRQPVWMKRTAPVAASTGGWHRISGPWPAATAGVAWVALPCGLLQSALVVAALANSPAGGAAAMAAFALASAPALQLAPWAWNRLSAGPSGQARLRWAVRAAGVALLAGSGFAVGHQALARFVAWCTSG